MQDTDPLKHNSESKFKVSLYIYIYTYVKDWNYYFFVAFYLTTVTQLNTFAYEYKNVLI